LFRVVLWLPRAWAAYLRRPAGPARSDALEVALEGGKFVGGGASLFMVVAQILCFTVFCFDVHGVDLSCQGVSSAIDRPRGLEYPNTNTFVPFLRFSPPSMRSISSASILPWPGWSRRLGSWAGGTLCALGAKLGRTLDYTAGNRWNTYRPANCPAYRDDGFACRRTTKR